MSSSACVAVAALVLSGSLVAQTGPPPEEDDVHYGIPGQFSVKQVMDFYRTPVNASSKTSVILWIHGKGFWGGGESIDASAPPYSNWLAAGHSIVALDYQHSGQNWNLFLDGFDAVYPSHVADVSLAIQFLRMKSDDWNIDPEKILLYGESAGGCLASWVALAEDHAAFEGGVGHGADLSTRARGFVNYKGPTDFTYLNSFADPDVNPYFGVYVPFTAPFIVLVPLITQLEASPFWQATRAPVAEANRQVGAWQTFFGPVGGNLHDPFYGLQLQGALDEIDHGMPILHWDNNPDWPIGPMYNDLQWMELQVLGLPYGEGVGGSSPVSPEIYLRAKGPFDTLLVTDAPANSPVTFALGLSEVDVQLFGGRLYVQPLVFLYGTTDANGDCLLDLDLGLAEDQFDVFVQAAIEDSGAVGGYTLTGGLKLDLKR